MTDCAEIERLLNQTGRTLEGLPTQDDYWYSDDYVDRDKEIGMMMYRSGFIRNEPYIMYQSDVIELLVGALQDSEPKRKYGECYHCKNGTYSCPITQMSGKLIRYANFCDECGRDLRPIVAGYRRKDDENT